MERDDDSESERAGLLGAMGILNREVTVFEARLMLVSFLLLCIGSVGFGLFAGELSKLEDFRHSHPGGGDEAVITRTVTAPGGQPTRAPPVPDTVCYSGPCVDAAGELRKTLDWDADPCHEFDRFAMRRTETPVIDLIKTDIDRSIRHLFSTHPLGPTTQTLKTFHLTCTQNLGDYHAIIPFLRDISDVWRTQSSFPSSRTTRLTSALAYLHSHALPALFTNFLTNGTLGIRPAPVNLTDIEKTFKTIYPQNEVSRRLEGVKRLDRQLKRILHQSQRSVLVPIADLQRLVCSDKPAPCLMAWREYYSSLSSNRPSLYVFVDGLDYFERLPSVVASHLDETLESYFHWIAISSLLGDQVSCSRKLHWFFGPILSKYYSFAVSNGHRDLEDKKSSAEIVLHAIFNHDRDNPIEVVFPSINDAQIEELAAVEEGKHLDNLLRLSRIKTRKMFEDHESGWDMLGPAIDIKAHQVYCPASILQNPVVYASPDVPISLTFGALGVWVTERLVRGSNPSSSQYGNLGSKSDKNATIRAGIRAAFSSWQNGRKGPKYVLAGLESLTEEQLFFIAFARLGTSHQASDVVELPEFIKAFNCKPGSTIFHDQQKS